MATEQEIAELTAVARELLGRLDSLVDGTGDQMVHLSKRAKQNRSMILALSFSLFLDVGLTVVMALGLMQLTSLTDRVDRQQTITQREALCPLYRQFINADTPQARQLAERNGQDMEKRAEAFRVIRHGFDILNCK